MTRPPARSSSTAPMCARSTSSRCAGRSPSYPTTLSCSRRACARTSPTRARRQPTRKFAARLGAPGSPTSSRAWPRAARPRLPHREAARAGGGAPMTPLRARLSRLDALRRSGPTGRGRKVRGLLELLRPYRVRVALLLVCLPVATAAALAPPYLLGRAIDDGVRAGDGGALLVIVALFVAAALVAWVASYAQTYLVNWVGQRALQDLRARIFSHLQRLSIGFYSRNRAGVLISRITNDVQALDHLVTDGVQTLFASTLTLIGTAAVLLFLDAELALVTFLVFPVLAVGSVAFRIASSEAYRLTREKVAWVTAHLQETISGVRIVRAFGQEGRHKQRFAELNDDNRQANMRTVALNAAYFPSVELLSAVATAAILLYGGRQALAGDGVTIGVLASFVFYLNSFFDPIQQLSQLYTTYQAG